MGDGGFETGKVSVGKRPRRETRKVRERTSCFSGPVSACSPAVARDRNAHPTGSSHSTAIRGSVKGPGSPTARYLPLSRCRLTGVGSHRETAAPRLLGFRGRARPSPEPVASPLAPSPDRRRKPWKATGKRPRGGKPGVRGRAWPSPELLLPLSRRRGRGGWGVGAAPADPVTTRGYRHPSDTYPF